MNSNTSLSILKIIEGGVRVGAEVLRAVDDA
jgi:hypothetical protein